MNKLLISVMVLAISIGLVAQGKSEDKGKGKQEEKSLGKSQDKIPSQGKLGAKKQPKAVMNVQDFMEDYTKTAMKHFKKTGDRSYLTRLVKEFPPMAVEDHQEKWTEIVDKALAEDKPESSCKSCHDLYKKEYKKKYRKREITIPESILGLDKEIKALK